MFQYCLSLEASNQHWTAWDHGNSLHTLTEDSVKTCGCCHSHQRTMEMFNAEYRHALGMQPFTAEKQSRDVALLCVFDCECADIIEVLLGQ